MTSADITLPVPPGRHALRLLALALIQDELEALDKTARVGAQPVFLDAATDPDAAATKWKPRLNGVPLGEVRLNDPGEDAPVDQAKLTEWADAHRDDAYEFYLPGHVLEDPRVRALIRKHLPELGYPRIRPDWRAKQVKDALAKSNKHRGRVYDEAGNFADIIPVITARPHTGKPVVQPPRDAGLKAQALAAVLAGMHDGTLAAAAGTAYDGFLAIEAPAEAEIVDDAPAGEQLAAYIDGLAADLGHPVSRCGGWHRQPEDGKVTCFCGEVLNHSNAGWAGKAAA
jgi:hypothetical protein